jgi:hypothetical protein
MPGQFMCQTALADTRFTADQKQPPVPADRVIKSGPQFLQLRLPSDEGVPGALKFGPCPHLSPPEKECVI